MLSAKTTKAIFKEYADELSQDDLKQLITRLTECKFSQLVFSLFHPFAIELKKKITIYTMVEGNDTVMKS